MGTEAVVSVAAESSWSGLEIAKLVVSALTPVTVALVAAPRVAVPSIDASGGQQGLRMLTMGPPTRLLSGLGVAIPEVTPNQPCEAE